MKDLRYADNLREQMLAWATVLDDIGWTYGEDDKGLVEHILPRICDSLPLLTEGDGLPWLYRKIDNLLHRIRETLATGTAERPDANVENDDDDESQEDRGEILRGLARRLREDARLFHFVLTAKAAEDWLAHAREQDEPQGRRQPEIEQAV
jgi:hypothetical protein